MTFWTKTRAVMLIVLLGLIAFKTISCDGGIGGGEGCDGMTNLEWGQYPEDEKITNLAQIRVTQPGFEFISRNAIPLVETFMGGPLSFPIDEQNILGICSVCEGGCTGDDAVEINIASIEITPVWPNILEVDINLPANFEITLPMDCALGVHCDARLHTNGAPVTITTNIRVDTDNDTGLLDLRVDPPQVPYDQLYASVCNFGDNISNGLIGIFQGMIRDYIKDMLTGIVEGFKCVSCESEACPPHPIGYDTYCVDGICRIGLAENDECMLQPLGIEAEINIGSFLEGFLPGIESYMWVSALAGGQAQVINSGLEIGMFGGTMVPPTQPEPCTGFVEYPANGTTLGRIEIDNENLHYTPPIPYHVGIGLHEEMLDQAGYTLLNTGLLCLELDENTPQIGQYVGPATFALLLPDINYYTHNENPPWKLGLEPGAPIDFKILDAAAAYPDDPNSEVDTALQIIIKDLKLHFFSLVEDRQVRLFTLEIDVEVTAGLQLQGAEIIPVLDGDSIKIINYRIPFSAVGTPPAEAAAKFDSFISGLLGTLLGELLGDISGFEIPGFDITGDGVEDLFIDIQSIMPEIAKGGGEYGALYVYAALSFANRMAAPPFEAETKAEIVDSYLPMPEHYMDADEHPTLVLSLSGVDADGTSDFLEYQYSTNGGKIWSPYRKGNIVTITDGALLLQGNHEIWVRARDSRFNTSFDRTPERFIFTSDYTRPRLRLMREGDTGLRFVGSDNLSSAENLEYRMRVNNGEWSDWSATATGLDLMKIKTFPATITVEVADEVGLTATITRTFEDSIIDDAEVIDLSAPAGETVGQAMGGCSSSAGNSAWLLLLLALPLFILRRGVKAMPVMLALVALSGGMLIAGCSDDGQRGTPCTTNADCGAGEWCDNGWCAPVEDGDEPDADIDIPDGDEDGDEPDGDKPDGDIDGDDDEIVLPDDCTIEDCPPCYYCATRTGECKKQECDPTCDGIPSCAESTGDDCSQCTVTADSQAANICETPRCTVENEAQDCACRSCETAAEVVYCAADTGECVCAEPCRCGEGQACCLVDNPAGDCMTCPEWCAGVECEPGFAPGSCDPTRDDECIWADQWALCSNFDSDTCTFTGVGMPDHGPSCGCQEKPPVPLGWYGRYSDMAVYDDEHIWVSAYNETYGDLMIGRAKYSKLTQGLDELHWNFIDGVPWDEEPDMGPSGVRRGITEKGNDVGKYTSLALSADGWPRVAYLDVDNGDLVFMYTDGEAGHPSDADGDVTDGDMDADSEAVESDVEAEAASSKDVDGDTEVAETTETVDGDDEGETEEFPNYKWTKLVVDTEGDTGYFADLWLDAQGRPVIAYMMKSNDEGTVSALKLAMATTATPTSPGDFVIVTIDTAAIGQRYCADPDSCPDYDDIPIGLGINPKISQHPSGETWLTYYHYTTYEQTQVSDGDGNTITVNDNVLKGNLKRARLAGGLDPATLPTASWTKEVFLGNGATLIDGNVGVFHSVHIFQTNGWYAVAVYNKTLNQVQVVFDFGAGLKVQTIDDGWRRDNNGDDYQIKVGADCDMIIDNGGSIRILYQDQSNDKLMYYQANFDSQGPVGEQSRVALLGMAGGVDRDGNALEFGQAFGFYPSQALVAGVVGIYTSYVVDVTNPSAKKKIMELRLGTTTFVR